MISIAAASSRIPGPVPPVARYAPTVRAARTRLPGVPSAYAIAGPSGAPSRAARRPARASRRRSTPSRTSASSAAPAATGSGREIAGPEFTIRLRDHGLHLEAGLGEALAGRSQARNTFLEQRERHVQVHVVRFQLPDDRLEPRQVRGQ